MLICFQLLFLLLLKKNYFLSLFSKINLFFNLFYRKFLRFTYLIIYDTIITFTFSYTFYTSYKVEVTKVFYHCYMDIKLLWFIIYRNNNFINFLTLKHIFTLKALKMVLTVLNEYKNILYLDCQFKLRRMNDIIAISFFLGEEYK